jgi:hypothetical protein
MMLMGAGGGGRALAAAPFSDPLPSAAHCYKK